MITGVGHIRLSVTISLVVFIAFTLARSIMLFCLLVQYIHLHVQQTNCDNYYYHFKLDKRHLFSEVYKKYIYM